MEAWYGDGRDNDGDYPSLGGDDGVVASSVPVVANGVKQQLATIERTRWDDKVSHPEYAFDRSLLAKRDPLTQAEIDYINLQLTNAVRKLATAYGCAAEDVEKIKADCWHEKKCSYKEGNHVWGIFYDCDQNNFEDKDLPNAPRLMASFMRDFECALGQVDFNEANTVPLPEGGRQAVGWSQKGWRDNHAIMRGGSRDVLLPIMRLIELLDPSFTLRFDVPQQYSSIYDGMSDLDLTKMADAPESAFWIDRDWAQQELERRASGKEWRDMQARIDESRVVAREEARPQTLRERLKIAFSSSHISAVDPETPSGAKSR